MKKKIIIAEVKDNIVEIFQINSSLVPFELKNCLFDDYSFGVYHSYVGGKLTGVYAEYERLDMNKKTKSEKIEIILREIDEINEKYGVELTPEEYYDSLEPVPYVLGKQNWYVRYFHNGDNELFCVEHEYARSIPIGCKYISKEDAIKFFELFNKED